MSVFGDREVPRRPADLEQAATFALARSVDRHPDGLDEEMLAEDHRDEALVLADSPRRLTQVREAVLTRRIRPHRVEVVAKHQPLRCSHRRLGLVPVRALGERQQPRDARDGLLLEGIGVRAFTVGRRARPRVARRHPGGARVDPEPGAGVAKGGAVRGLARLAEDLVDVLVRHFVLEHLDDDTPGPLDDEGERDLDRARTRHPAAERCAPGHELERRSNERTPEVRVVELSPRRQELPRERGLERSGQLRGERPISAGTGSAAIHHVESNLSRVRRAGERVASGGARTRGDTTVLGRTRAPPRAARRMITAWQFRLRHLSVVEHGPSAAVVRITSSLRSTHARCLRWSPRLRSSAASTSRGTPGKDVASS